MIFLKSEDIQKRIKELADLINEDFKGQEVTFIPVLKGSFMFFSDLIKHINLDSEIEFISVQSYNGQYTTGEPVIACCPESLNNKNVIIVEDILDTGITLDAILLKIFRQEPANVKIAVLLDKPSRRRLDIYADYVGFKIENKFVFGYGLDLNQKFRNLPDIHVNEFTI